MTPTNQPIAVIGSGVAGLSSVAALKKILPCEDIIYCGDNANVPYSQRSGEEIVALTRHMLDFLRDRQVKVVAIASDTIASTINSAKCGYYDKSYEFPMVSIITPTVINIRDKQLREVGVIGTPFTVQSLELKQQIQAQTPGIQIYTEPVYNLSKQIEQGDFGSAELVQSVQAPVHALLAQHPYLVDIVLGCTYAMLIPELFSQAAPEVSFINPAHNHAFAVKNLLKAHRLLREEHEGTLQIYASANLALYPTVFDRMGIKADEAPFLVNFSPAAQ